ncbi:NAD(P)H-binding protein [Deinococcus sp.]|uniref:SDR family oxidoreductase n=1 Tax=Deinococcus sp. TaxID=47478 RepID=UPI002869A6E6|nr:NAD(P)H-binding protein [Deinococcus sp.]
MTRVLVTGGTGVLGQRIAQQLRARHATVVTLSRRAPAAPTPGLEWVPGDLITGAGLDEALCGVQAVVHAATSQRAREDVQMTQRLLDAAVRAKVEHLLYVSIVGIDHLSYFDYYAAKLEGERRVAASGVPYSVQRATQFHDFVAYLLGRMNRFPVLTLPRRIRLQPVDPDAVAARIAYATLNGVAGRLPDLAGPEAQSLETLAHAWLRAMGQRKRTWSVPMPLPIFRAMAVGDLAPAHAVRIGPSWEAWLAATVAGPGRAAADGAFP